ncbi:MAG: hypothetical protein O4805_01665 [Trichodesmium sp. St16_bin2-tuft]|uniref:hypothetical protein n=1 Tax=Trichodesmium erythraeum TaxID=1206 RepID=UPI00003C9BAC|nr:hypothetical protein [Trichodesmium erythraeum GBRTRLIN201]MCH2048429.1 hypothetical protein [Trichodesmium sp. ALOHA_ZT_67]MDE5085919.1 hypothetical protein [Trichodesmium sp. St16_bin2-tuft]MDE5094285.1 hypothetical protein [Trichodesmium sp. St11_bin5]MDE5102222.1 hypothetical protein [Trichodesmium sp. St19_bin2]MDT9340715.1 hypothetical protein [Trichodesmium erythraeum 21-75]
MSNRRRPQLKQEVNINLLRYMTLCISFIEQSEVTKSNGKNCPLIFRRGQSETLIV